MIYSPLLIVIYGFIIFILSLASAFDIKSREVPDFISYVFLVGAILLILILAIYEDSLQVLEFIPLSFALLFGFAYLMYRLGQWGGGDAKLMLGFSFLFTNISLNSSLSFVNLFINMLLFGGFYGLFAILALGVIKHKEMKQRMKIYDYVLLVAGAIAIILVYFLIVYPLNILLSLMVLLLVVIRYIYIVSMELMYRDISVSKLTEGDWLADDVIKDGKIVIRRTNIGLTAEDINKLKSEEVKQVRVKIGLPFIPGILLGAIVTIFFLNPVLSLFAL
ncbi:prepilin peptidase [Candidatus Parvarchaeota archaeon]|uniref:Prepilin peptidase n=1 Tax=Candidatus Acidifodinimicrobium mancum TaxID=2898728 RepID=A0A8T3UVI0_9ARCH|nr:prepilin peptidase [Candidatus Acidifodinimicrobium mancum]MBE5728854.1 prepilin peptidase [Candidatus Acidifodinimicrobium mancum]MBE5730118.1 prepilin peptidase [Candidatus Acidifodinimicrobium mancum]